VIQFFPALKHPKNMIIKKISEHFQVDRLKNRVDPAQLIVFEK